MPMSCLVKIVSTDQLVLVCVLNCTGGLILTTCSFQGQKSETAVKFLNLENRFLSPFFKKRSSNTRMTTILFLDSYSKSAGRCLANTVVYL